MSTVLTQFPIDTPLHYTTTELLHSQCCCHAMLTQNVDPIICFGHVLFAVRRTGSGQVQSGLVWSGLVRHTDWSGWRSNVIMGGLVSATRRALFRLPYHPPQACLPVWLKAPRPPTHTGGRVDEYLFHFIAEMQHFFLVFLLFEFLTYSSRRYIVGCGHAGRRLFHHSTRVDHFITPEVDCRCHTAVRVHRRPLPYSITSTYNTMTCVVRVKQSQ